MSTGFKHSEETKQKLREARIGIKLSKEHKEKIGLFFKGKKHSPEHIKKVSDANRGKKRSSEFKKKMSAMRKKVGSPWLFGRPVSLLTREKMSKSHKGFIMSEDQKRKIGIGNKGKIISLETRQKYKLLYKGKPHPEQAGEKSPFWKGGITPIYQKIRHSLEYKLWREAVFKRDNYQCIWCSDNRGGNLNADHIKPFASYPELRFAIDNGRTLCVPCHRTTDTYGNRMNKRSDDPLLNRDIMNTI